MFIAKSKIFWKTVCASLCLVSLAGCSVTQDSQNIPSVGSRENTSVFPNMSSEGPNWPDLNPGSLREAKTWKICGTMSETDKELTCDLPEKGRKFRASGICYIDADKENSESSNTVFWNFYQNRKKVSYFGVTCTSDVNYDSALGAAIPNPDNFDPANGPVTIKVDQLPEGAQFRFVLGTVEDR